ncbi:hypothetical protein L9F63_020093, partial [Diploptera punctata]
MVSTAPKSKWSGHKQRRMGPAPFASFEDLSDDLDSPEEKQSVTRILPGIREDVSLRSPSAGGVSLQTPSTPRIDISRASSSSHHDSNNSSPERELFAGEVSGAKLGLGFKEEGAADLRSSTEELDFHEDPGAVAEREVEKRKERRASKQSQQHASIFKYELEAQSEKERKDSACSDAGLLSISGRTSRLSSIGSGGSGASHFSGMSHLSVMSGHSAASSGRSPSPHKMLLETSFCGSKPIPVHSIDMESPPNKHETESLEKALLSRKIDPTVAIVGDIKSEQVQKNFASKKLPDVKEKHNNLAEVQKVEVSSQETKPVEIQKPEVKTVRKKPEQEVQKKKEIEEISPRQEPQESIYRNEWQLRDRDEWGPHIKQKPASLNLSNSGKKPMTFSQLVQHEQQPEPPPVRQQPVEVISSASPKLPRHAVRKKVEDDGSRTPSPTHGSRKSSFTAIFKRNEESVLSPESPTVVSGKRKSSGLTTILKEASDGLRDRSRSRSKSRERVVTTPGDAKGKKDNKNKSVFSSLFKKREKKKGSRNVDDDIISPVDIPQTEQKLDAINVEFTFNSSGSYRDEKETHLGSSAHAEECTVDEDNATKHVFSNVHSEEIPIVADSSEEVHVNAVDEEDLDDSLLPSESVMLPALCQDSIQPVSKSLEAGDSASITDHHSSESERDSEVDYLRNKKKEVEAPEEDHERKGLVVQQDSFDDELPYVPTTLPLERSVALPIIPIKQRIAEVKTCPIERPRSTTPINPSLLEDYLPSEDTREHAIEKMRICLPREDSITSRSKSPRRVTKTWSEFAEQGIQSPREYRKPSLTEKSAKSPCSPPPLPPRSHSTPPVPTQTPPPKPTSWINFEEIPEKRKPPKRIQTIPSRGTLDLPVDVAEKTVYSYVNPEECKCECHEASGRQQPQQQPAAPTQQCSHLEVDPCPDWFDLCWIMMHTLDVDVSSILCDSSYEFPSPYSASDGPDYSDGLKPMKPFGMDLDVTSNRSSIISQDEPQSPELGSPNDNEIRDK